ncbi:hypothetical protein [Amycolatopsis granulosa]|uniref:hypothetical protein n=1 Tax=Amycolatopsis granulosa TaxID=185684 RepID=UPI0014227BE1|nr:hypothetical protein [Amycolatopsis granulosa]NIH83814.1 hypothetical protein [Amycolatopsis granulosa]
MNEKRFSPFPLAVAGAPGRIESRVLARQAEWQNDWFEVYLDANFRSLPARANATVMLDEFEVDFVLAGNKIIGLSARLDACDFTRTTASFLLPPGEPASVHLGLDFDPEDSDTYEYSDYFAFRLISEEGLYAGKVSPADMPQWTFSSAGYWVGVNQESSLCAILIPFDSVGRRDYRKVMRSNSYRLRKIVRDIFGRR